MAFFRTKNRGSTTTTQNGTVGVTGQLAGCQVALWLPYQNYWHAKVIAGKSDNCTLAVR